MPPARGSCQQPRQAGACSPAAPPSDRLRDVKQPCRAHRSDLAGVRDPRPRRAHQGESSTTRAKRATERTNLRKMRPRRRFAAGSRSKARGGSAPHILRFWGKSVRSKFLLRFCYVSPYSARPRAESWGFSTVNISPARLDTTRYGDASGPRCSAVPRTSHAAGDCSATKERAAPKNGPKRDFRPFNGQLLGIETIDPPFLLARCGATLPAHALAKS